jgi:hypothetical protein
VIDAEVRADVEVAGVLGRTSAIAAGVLDGVTWVAHTLPHQAVELHPAWAKEPLLTQGVRSSLRIGRADLLDTAQSCRQGGTWLPLLVAVNAWGYGISGYGAWRTSRIAGLPDAEVRLAAAVATLDADGPVEAYYLLNNDGYLHGWGPAFFTRFLHLADRRADQPGAECALVLDTPLADAVNALVPGSDLGHADWGTAEYAFHLALLHRIAGDVGVNVSVVQDTLYDKFQD